MSPGPESLLLLAELEDCELDDDDSPDVSEALMLVSAEDSADSSDELMAPEDTSDWSSDSSC
jgi:hypothetical protein